MRHFHESEATAHDIDRIWLAFGETPVVLGAIPSEGAIGVLRLVPCKLGRGYRKTHRCPVNGDGYWYYRREPLSPDGRVVGSVAVQNTGGEL
jgi:hypothetical protein